MRRNMIKIKEKPFDFLRRMKDGTAFDKSVLDNWYQARAFVLEKIKDVAFRPDDNHFLHVVVNGDSPLMLSVVRQVALSAHYTNFFEGNEHEHPRNRTVITLVSKMPTIRKELEKEEYLFNLPKYCKYSEWGSTPENEDSFIDIEIRVVEEWAEKGGVDVDQVFTESEVQNYCRSKEAEGMDIHSIDTLKAIYANRMYGLGAIIDNLPAEDIHCAKRYTMALDVFQHEKLKDTPKPLFSENMIVDNNAVREILSNIFCADCFESREKSIKLMSKGDERKEKELWEKNNEALSRSEHSRWVVEKLIMGYSPLNAQQRFMDECLFYDKKKRKQYRNRLKRNSTHPAHIDLCSYSNLRRINPDDMKFDSFLMLAIPVILRKTK